MICLKYFDDDDSVKFLNYYQYGKLVLSCKKYLEAHKFIYLPIILVANCEKFKERPKINGNSIVPKIRDSNKYYNLFKTKYKYFEQDAKSALEKFIASTYGSIFKDNEGNEIFDSSIKVGKIADEAIDLAYLI